MQKIETIKRKYFFLIGIDTVKKAGILRNIEMFEYISKYQNIGCVVFWDGKSRGTANDIKLAQKYNIPLRVVRF